MFEVSELRPQTYFNCAVEQDFTVQFVTCNNYSIKLIRGRGKPLHYKFDGQLNIIVKFSNFVVTGLALSDCAVEQDCTVQFVTCNIYSIILIRGRGKPLHYIFADTIEHNG